jgi:sialate O-acetylesterase
MKINIIKLFTLCLICLDAFANVTPNSLFTNNMVLQQGVTVPVWGKASENEKVTVEFCGQKVSTITKEGKWFIKLRPLKSGGPFVMTIKGQNTLIVTNVLVGEVWICSGQSNMARKLGVQEYQPDITDRQITVNDAVNYPHIRQYFVPLKGSETKYEDANSNWVVCDTNTVKDFTAVGYFFARDLSKRNKNVPVGLINSSWGGTAAEKWTSRAALEGNPELKYIVEKYDKSVLTYPKDLENYNKHKDSILEAWKVASAKARKNGNTVPMKPESILDPTKNGGCGGLYNAMIAPLIPYAIKGVIWYQGESDKWKAKQYQTLFPLMISDWRKDWKIGDFPFLFVQVAPYNSMFPEIRESQLLCLKKTVNTAMAVTVDCGVADKIHPPDKKTVGERLALAAEALAYNKKLAYSGPLYSSMQVKGNSIVLSFDHLNDGLIVKGESLTDFVIAGVDKKFVPAKAVIVGDTIIVSAESVSNPVAVRMGWANVPNITLYNKNGLPASPFRTDLE